MSEVADWSSAVWIDDRAGRRWTLEPGTDFLVGRAGNLAFDDNPYLHRSLLQLSFHDAFWWIANVGSRIPIKLIDGRTGMPTILPPGASTILVAAEVLAVFEAGPTVYEIAFGLCGVTAQPPVRQSGSNAQITIGPGLLNREQVMLLVAMAEPILRYPGSGLDVIPTIPAVAARLGWSVTKVNRKIDYLCQKLADGGVSGLVSSARGQALNRRTRLVEYAIITRLITEKSLSVLEG